MYKELSEEEFINSISEKFSIKKNSDEKYEIFKLRVFYSVFGLLYLESIYSNYCISKKKAKNELQNYIKKYRNAFDIKKLKYFDYDVEDLKNNIEEVYRKAGYIYDKKYYYLKANYVENVCLGMKFFRGDIPANTKISGLGLYNTLNDEENYNNCSKFIEMFNLNTINIKELVDYDNLKFIEYSIDNIDEISHVESLNILSNKKYLMWKLGIIETDKINIFRNIDIKSAISKKDYYYYKIRNGKLFISKIDEWKIDEMKQLIISNILLKYNRPLVIRYKINENLVFVNLKYKLGKYEEIFLKLYSWPDFKKFLKINKKSINEYNRVFDINIFVVFKKIMENQGYIFKEGYYD